MLRPFLVGLALLGFIQIGSAQLQVDIKLKRTLYISYEPILITVSLTNLSGNPLPLHQDSQHLRPSR